MQQCVSRLAEDLPPLTDTCLGANFEYATKKCRFVISPHRYTRKTGYAYVWVFYRCHQALSPGKLSLFFFHFLDYNMRIIFQIITIVQSICENYWHNLKQIAIEFCSAGMHAGKVSLKHSKMSLHHLWKKQVKSPMKVTFSH